MKIGDLKEHADFPTLLKSLKEIVDKEKEAVVRGARTKSEAEFRYQAGRHDLAAELLVALKRRS